MSTKALEKNIVACILVNKACTSWLPHKPFRALHLVFVEGSALKLTNTIIKNRNSGNEQKIVVKSMQLNFFINVIRIKKFSLVYPSETSL